MLKILIGVPTIDRRIDIDLFKTLINVERQNKYHLDFLFPVSSLLSRNRNMCAREALNYDYLLFLDSDISINDPAFIDKMLETAYKFDAKIVCGAYRIREADLSYRYTLAYENGEKYDNLKEIKQQCLVDAGGTGIMLIAKEVLQKMEEPWFTVVDGKDLHVIPEDFNFCKKAKGLGFKIAADPRFITNHVGNYMWKHEV